MDKRRIFLQPARVMNQRLPLAIAAALLTAALPSSAVTVAGTTGNTTAPGDDPGWANVGSCNSASAVYLGNRWVLTAWHVNALGNFPVVFGNTAYTVSGPVNRLTNNGTGGMSAQTDLILFQINADPGLPSLSISASAPVLGNDLVMIGNGRNRLSSRTFWQVTQNAGGNNDVWTETTGAHNVEGFKWDGATASKRWGTNDVEGLFNVSLPTGDVRSMVTLFHDDLAGRPNEAQAMVGDSGGGVFFKNGAQWELSGIMLATGTFGNPTFFDNAPADTAAFGQHVTVAADLSFYRNQIAGLMIPEPSAALMLLSGSALLLQRRRRA